MLWEDHKVKRPKSELHFHHPGALSSRARDMAFLSPNHLIYKNGDNVT